MALSKQIISSSSSVEKEVKIINYKQDFWYTKELYETLEK